MSYNEYTDLFIKAQKNNSPYLAFVFDIKNSKYYSDGERFVVQEKTFKTINMVTEKIKLLEKLTNKKILIKEPLMTIVDDIKNCSDCFPILPNPWFSSGDAFAFFCYNHTITKEQFKKIFVVCAKKCENNYPYHFTTAKFETLDYLEASKKYYAGYVIPQCTEKKHKNKGNIINYLK